MHAMILHSSIFMYNQTCSPGPYQVPLTSVQERCIETAFVYVCVGSTLTGYGRCGAHRGACAGRPVQGFNVEF